MLNPYALLRWIEGTWLSTTIRQSSWAVMALESVHLLGLALLGGAALIGGMAAIPGELRGIRLGRWVSGLWPMIWTGLTVLAVSGIPIALSMPFKYYNNPAFRWKMLLLIGALLATIGLVGESRRATLARPRLLRTLMLLAQSLWLGVACSGRFIGFL